MDGHCSLIEIALTGACSIHISCGASWMLHGNYNMPAPGRALGTHPRGGGGGNGDGMLLNEPEGVPASDPHTV